MRQLKTRKADSLPASLTLARTPRRIFVPLDFSACSLQALRHALRLVQLCQAEIVLLHVVEPLHPGLMLESSETRRLHNLALHEARHRLAELARISIRPHASVRYLVREGKPFEVSARIALC